MPPREATCSPDARGLRPAELEPLQTSQENSKRGGAESFLKWAGPRRPERSFPRGGADHGAWFSSAAVTMTSIQIRMASGLGATI